jgi:hypothetical protein
MLEMHAIEPQVKDRLRLVLVAMGVAMIAIPVIVATVWLVPGLNHVNWKWGRFTVVTAFFVVYCLKTYWRDRKHLEFWGILFVIFVIHFVGVGFFFYAGPGLPLFTFGPVVGLEWGLLAVAVYHFLGIGPPAHKRQS